MCCLLVSLVEAVTFLSMVGGAVRAGRGPALPVLRFFAMSFRCRVLFHGLACIGLVVSYRPTFHPPPPLLPHSHRRILVVVVAFRSA
jgi:hypothetical protein